MNLVEYNCYAIKCFNIKQLSLGFLLDQQTGGTMIKLARSIYARHLYRVKMSNELSPGARQAVHDVLAGRYNPQGTTQTVNTTKTPESSQTRGVSVKPSNVGKFVNNLQEGKVNSPSYFTSPDGIKALAPTITYNPKNSWLDNVTVSPLQDIPINLEKDLRNPNNPADDRPLQQNPYRSDSIPVDYGIQIKGKFR